MSRPVDAHRALERALVRQLGEDRTHIATSTSRPWASITFSGARHIWDLRNSCASHSWDSAIVNALATHEFAIPGHIVADLIATMTDDLLRVEALTVELN